MSEVSFQSVNTYCGTLADPLSIFSGVGPFSNLTSSKATVLAYDAFSLAKEFNKI